MENVIEPNEEAVKACIEKIRPYLQHDGGDLEFVRLEKGGVVVVNMLGACSNCLSIFDTLTAGVEAILADEVEGVTKVVLDQNPSGFPFDSDSQFDDEF